MVRDEAAGPEQCREQGPEVRCAARCPAFQLELLVDTPRLLGKERDLGMTFCSPVLRFTFLSICGDLKPYLL